MVGETRDRVWASLISHYAVTYVHFRALPCTHMQSHAITCTHVRSSALSCATVRMRAGAHVTGVRVFRDYTAETGMIVPGPHDPRYSTPPRGSLTRRRRHPNVYASAPECHALFGVRLPRDTRGAGGDNLIAGGCIEYRMGTRFAQAWSPYTGTVTAQEVCTYRATIPGPTRCSAATPSVHRVIVGSMSVTTRSLAGNGGSALRAPGRDVPSLTSPACSASSRVLRPGSPYDNLAR